MAAVKHVTKERGDSRVECETCGEVSARMGTRANAKAWAVAHRRRVAEAEKVTAIDVLTRVGALVSSARAKHYTGDSGLMVNLSDLEVLLSLAKREG